MRPTGHERTRSELLRTCTFRRAEIGGWSTEAKHRLVDEVVPGGATFEWLEGGQLVVLRSRNDHDLFPDAIGVIGRPEWGEGLVMGY